jgi:hypothetical protein
MPDIPPVIYVPPSAGSPPAAPGAVFAPPSAGSPPAAPGAVFAPPTAVPQALRVTGVSTTEDAVPEMTFLRVADVGGHPAWQSNQFGEWTLTNSGMGTWNLTENDDGFYAAESPPGALPVGLTGWTVTTGSGSPTVVGFHPAPPAVFP